jgi:hypothetical protein
MKLLPIFSALTLVFASSAFGASTYQFNATGQGGLTGFADHLGTLGTAQNGLRWGIIIDTAGNGFGTAAFDVNGVATSGSSYTETSFHNGSAYVTGGTFLTGTSGTDDYFYAPAVVPGTVARTAQGIDPGGNGGVLSLTGAPAVGDGLVAGLTAGDKFAIVWFESNPANGSYYGLYTHAGFTVPNAGPTTDFYSLFNTATAESLKTANLQFGAVAVPEPSRMMLLGFGLVGLFFRRRR